MKLRGLLMSVLVAVAVFYFVIPMVRSNDTMRHAINPEEILSGGPAKDGIPALNHPKFVSAKEAHFLRDTDKVLGISIKGEARAYPIKILNWHEAVNDTVAGIHLLATW